MISEAKLTSGQKKMLRDAAEVFRACNKSGSRPGLYTMNIHNVPAEFAKQFCDAKPGTLPSGPYYTIKDYEENDAGYSRLVLFPLRG